MPEKRKLSITVDAAVVAAAKQAVRRGDSPSVSAWIASAMRLRLERDAKLRGLAAYMREHEAEFGVITKDEQAAALREAKRRAIPVRRV